MAQILEKVLFMQPRYLAMRRFASTSLFCGALLLLPGACASDPPTASDDDNAGADDDDDGNDDRGARDGGGATSMLDGSRSGSDGSTTVDANRGSSGGDSGRTGNGGSDAASAGNTALCGFVPNDTGWVAATTNGAKAQGAVFTYASMGSQITPSTDATTPFETAGDGKLCVKGQAAQVIDEMFGVYYGAGLGFDLCANGETDTPPNQKYNVGSCPLAKGLVGLRFKLSGATIPSELRVQFKESMREEAAYVLAKSGANEALFKDGKVAYSMTAPPVDVSKIESVQFAIPTNADAATAFDFCIEEIVLLTESGTCKDGGNGASVSVDGGAGSSGDAAVGTGGGDASTAQPDAGGGDNSGSCARSGSSWSTTQQYGTRTFDSYVLRNNFWNQGAGGAGAQTLWGNSSRCWGVDSQHTDGSPKGTVKSYPDLQRGWGIGAAGFPNASHGLNIRVGDLTKAKIRWKMQAPTSGRTWALWDVYFHENNTPGSDRAPVNLMIQQRIVDSDGWMQQDSSGWPKVTIGGYTFRQKIETDTVSSTRTRIQLYVDQTAGAVLGVDDMKLDLKAVIDHFVAEGQIRASDYLTSIQAGWEIVSGGTYRTDEFWTAVQNEADGP